MTVTAWTDDKAESVKSLCDTLIEASGLMSNKVGRHDL